MPAAGAAHALRRLVLGHQLREALVHGPVGGPSRGPKGADLHCLVILIAQGDAAIRENTVELGIKESLHQRGITAYIQTG
jgi:hypothetical protein